MPYKGRRKNGPGSAGGNADVAKYGRAHMAKIGLLGAQALLDRHGCEHMAEIGRVGYRKAMQKQGLPFVDKRIFAELPPPPPVQLVLTLTLDEAA